MHCEMTDCYFNIYFIKIQLKIENLKIVFWMPEFGHPNWYTRLPNGLNASLVRYKNLGILDIITFLVFSKKHYFSVVTIVVENLKFRK